MLGKSQFRLNIISNAGGSAVNSVLQLAVTLVLAFILEEPMLAAYLIAVQVIALCETASDFGARLWATREFSTTANPRNILTHAVICKLFYTLCAIAVLACLPLNSLHLTDFLLSAMVAMTQPGTDPFLWYLRGRERLDIEAAVVLVCRIAVALGVVVSAWLGAQLSTLLLIWFACNVARMAYEAGLTVMRPLFQNAVDVKVSAPRVLQTLLDVFPIGTSLFLTALFARIGILLLDMLGTPQDVTIFGMGFRLVAAAGFVGTSVCVSSFAPLVKAIEANDSNETRAVISRMLKLTTMILVPMCFVGIVCAQAVGDLVLPDRLAGTGALMVVLMPGLYLSCINMSLRFTLTAFKLNWYDVAAIVMGIGVIALFIVSWDPQSRVIAASLGWIVGELAVLTARLSLLWRHSHHNGVPTAAIYTWAALLILCVSPTLFQ